MLYPNEQIFKESLAHQLESSPYNHDVYFSEGQDKNKFRIENTKKRVDLLLETNPVWEYHPIFPYLAIEVKLAKNTGWLVKAMHQCKEYSELKYAKYFIGEREIKTPPLVLLVTNHSWQFGHIYQWREPRIDYNPRYYAEGWWDGITELLDRVLWSVNVAILRDGWFLYKQKRYDLHTNLQLGLNNG